MHSYLNNRETLDDFDHELVALPTKLASQVTTQIDEFRHTLLHCYISSQHIHVYPWCTARVMYSSPFGLTLSCPTSSFTISRLPHLQAPHSSFT